MISRHWIPLSPFVLLAATAGAVSAATQWLQLDLVNGEPPAGAIQVGDRVVIGMYGNFDGVGNGSSGGKYGVNWDPASLALPEPATADLTDADSVQYVWPNFNPVVDGFVNLIFGPDDFGGSSDFPGGRMEAAWGTSQSGFGDTLPTLIVENFGPTLATGDFQIARMEFEVLDNAGGSSNIDLDGEVSLLTGDNGELGTLEFVGVTVPFSLLVVSPLTLDFGSVFIGTYELPVNATNNGAEPVTIGAIAATDLSTPFSIVADACSNVALASGESCTVSVQFAPDAVGVFDDSFAFPFLEKSPVEIAVTGSASLSVAVDYVPGGCPNILPQAAPGGVLVAILGSPGVDVADIDRASIRFAGVAPYASYVEDVATPFEPFIGRDDSGDCTDLGADGLDDLVLVFKPAELLAQLPTSFNTIGLPVPLRGRLTADAGGAVFDGEDFLTIPPAPSSATAGAPIDRAGRSPAALDRDGDGYGDSVDNCHAVANPDQRDSDGDGLGNRCDADFNNDCVVNDLDFAILKRAFFTSASDPQFNADLDLDGDGEVSFADMNILKTLMASASGRSSCR